MPRKAKGAASEGDAQPQESRRSTRIAEKPAPPPPPTKKPAAPRKKRAAEKTPEDAKEEPAAKKVKADEHPESEPKDKHETDHAGPSGTEKPASTNKPASRAKKPSSAVGSKPASKAKPASTAKSSGHATGAAETHPATIEEEKDDAEMEAEAEGSDAIKELQLGDVLPALALLNEKGQEVEVAKVAGDKGLVIFVVPKADTPGCTTQACGFRDSYPEFEKHGYLVYGLSNDTPSAQEKWQAKKSLPYSLLSDPKRTLIGALGAGKASTKRSHFVFEKGTGKLIDKSIGVKPADSPKHALELVQKHHPETA